MATSPSSVTKSTLLLVLLLSTVVTSQAHEVSCKNSWTEAVAFNGIWTDVGVTIVLEVKDGIVVEVYEGKGVKHVGQFKCPKHVTALEFVLKGAGLLEAYVTDFSGLGSTLQPGRRTLRDLENELIPVHTGIGGDVDIGLFENLGFISAGSSKP